MEVEEGNKIFRGALTNDEWLQVPSEISKKLEAFLEAKFDELFTSKALYEAKKTETGNYGQHFYTFLSVIIGYDSH